MIITIQPAKMEDYEELMKLYEEFYDGKIKFTDQKHDSFKEVFENLNSFISVAENEGKLVGFAAYSTRFRVALPQKIMQLDELFVTESYRKHGVGTRLVQVVEEKAHVLNCCGIYIESRIHRKIAHKFYEDIGYKNSGYYFKKVLK